MKPAVWFAIAAVLSFPLTSKSQTLDDIIAKNAQARGGLEKLHAIKALRITARVSEDDFRAIYRQETLFQGMARVRAYDGHTAWQINPFGGRRDPELISVDESKTLIDSADVE